MSQPDAFAHFDATQGRLDETLSRLLIASDRDRRIRTGEQYRELKSHLRVAESQIAVARKHYDDVASYYNARLRAFPVRLVAHALGYRVKPVFADLDQPDLPPPPAIHQGTHDRLRV